MHVNKQHSFPRSVSDSLAILPDQLLQYTCDVMAGCCQIQPFKVGQFANV